MRNLANMMEVIVVEYGPTHDYPLAATPNEAVTPAIRRKTP